MPVLSIHTARHLDILHHKVDLTQLRSVSKQPVQRRPIQATQRLESFFLRARVQKLNSELGGGGWSVFDDVQEDVEPCLEVRRVSDAECEERDDDV